MADPSPAASLWSDRGSNAWYPLPTEVAPVAWGLEVGKNREEIRVGLFLELRTF